MTEAFTVFLGYYLPYLPACWLAMFAVSKGARRLVIGYAAIFLLLLSVTLLGSTGCQHQDFMLRDCPFVGPNIAFGLSLATVWLMVCHFLLSPVIAVTAATLEWRARRAKALGSGRISD